MKTLFLVLALAPTLATAGEIWEWSRGHYTYTGENGYQAEGWQWAPNFTTWTDNRGRTWQAWQWAPGHWQIDDQ